MRPSRMLLPGIVAIFASAIAAPGGAWGTESIEKEMEKRALAGAESAPRWSAAESTIEASTAPMKAGETGLHWHITVDHFAGELKYPIGWPRIGYTLREPDRDWSGWDYLQITIYTQTTRNALPREPVALALYTPDKDSAYTRIFSDLAKDTWVRYRIRLSQVPHHNDVRLIQFHISESNYRHQDQVDFYFEEIVLLRYAKPTLLDFAPETAVAFADAKHLAVQFNVAGVKTDEKVDVACELRSGTDAVVKATTKASRGPQRMNLDLANANLPPGEYQIVARVGDGRETTAKVRLVESPWKKE